MDNVIHANKANTLLNSIFNELLEIFLEPEVHKSWLQKVVNLLKQYIGAKHLVLHTFIDNLIVCATDDLSFVNQKEQVKLENLDSKPYWFNDIYVVPLLNEGYLEVIWDNFPKSEDLDPLSNLFLMLGTALKNRSNLIGQEFNKNISNSLFKIEKIFNTDLSLKEQLLSVCKEIIFLLNVSRAKIKIFSYFSQLDNYVIDNNLSSEVINGLFIPSLSVITTFEKQWLDEMQKSENLILNQSYYDNLNNSLNDAEELLSIKSIFGCPLFYKSKPIGVIVLHQCDYNKVWKTEEINYIRHISTLLSILIGKEIELKKKYDELFCDLNTGLINSDEFLRELNRIQIEAQISNSCFSLIMVDIEKLRDINLEMGFVAGNLVLSQTARYIKRLFPDAYSIARYSNDEFIIILKGFDQSAARLEVEKLKDCLNNITVLGVGTVDYNFSFVTFPTHAQSIAELLTLLEQAMLLSKSRGKSQISGYDEIQGQSKGKWQQLLSKAIPEIILKKSSFKTGPEIFENIKEQWSRQENIYSADILDSIQSLALALDAKDSYTEGHSKRVSEYAILLAKKINLDLGEIEWIRLAAVMHDIGKIGIPESILCKPGKLTKEEYEVMKKHPVIGARILSPIKPLEKVANLVLYHHEYWDGSGYPNGLSKTEIPLGARIVSIVDAYQAMTSNRPYRNALGFDEAIKRLKDGKEKQWDPELIELFIKIVS